MSDYGAFYDDSKGTAAADQVGEVEGCVDAYGCVFYATVYTFGQLFRSKETELCVYSVCATRVVLSTMLTSGMNDLNHGFVVLVLL